MASKYAKQFKSYAEKASKPAFVPRPKMLNRIFVSKNSPSVYVQPLGKELLPVPFHQFIATKNNSNEDFICRGFIDEPCYICDNIPNNWDASKPSRPSTQYLCLAIKMKDSAHPELTDYNVSKEFGEKVLKKNSRFAKAKHETEGDRMTFFQLPYIGVFSVKKNVSESFSAYMMESGVSFNDSYKLKREGEKLKTTYTLLRVGDGFDYEKSLKFHLALALHMTIDDYIDDLISEKHYTDAFGPDAVSGVEFDSSDEDIDDSDDDFDDIEDDGPSGSEDKSDAETDDAESDDDSDDDELWDDDEEDEDSDSMSKEEFQDLVNSKYRKNAKKSNKSDDV